MWRRSLTKHTINVLIWQGLSHIMEEPNIKLPQETCADRVTISCPQLRIERQHVHNSRQENSMYTISTTDISTTQTERTCAHIEIDQMAHP